MRHKLVVISIIKNEKVQLFYSQLQSFKSFSLAVNKLGG